MAALALERPAPALALEPPALALEPPALALKPPALALEPPTLAPEPAPEPIPAPAAVWVQDGTDDDDDVNVLALLRLRDRLKEQLVEYNTAILANQEDFIDQLKTNAIETKLVQSATKDLEESIEGVKVSLQNKTLALQRVQIMDALRNKLEQDDEDSRRILETMKQIGLLSRTIMEHQRQAQEKEEQMIDLKRKRLCLKVDEGQKLQQIQTMKKMQEEKRARVNVSETEKNKIEQEKQMTTIIQNVFQNLIIGSRVNWAEDPSLKPIVLQLEHNVYLH